MEFTSLLRYRKVDNPKILPFEKLRKMEPVLMTQDLLVVDEPDNICYVNSLAEQGNAVVPIRRVPRFNQYLERTNFPRRILFEMTSRCNYFCRMCPQQNLKRPQMDMPGEFYRKVIDEIDSYGVEGLWVYHLGESLLHPEFHENITHISSKKNLGIVWMSTNGYYFNEENIRKIFDSNIDYINFSMHATTRKTYETIVSKDSFDIVQGNLDKYYELKGANDLPRKPYLHCQMIEQETTRHEVDAFIEKHYKYAEIVSINMLEHVNLPNNQYGLQQRERDSLSSCFRISQNDCFICSNGMVTPCDASYNGEVSLGNVHEESLFDIWNGEARQRVLELDRTGCMHEIEFCSKCTDYDIKRG